MFIQENTRRESNVELTRGDCVCGKFTTTLWLVLLMFPRLLPPLPFHCSSIKDGREHLFATTSLDSDLLALRSHVWTRFDEVGMNRSSNPLKVPGWTRVRRYLNHDKGRSSKAWRYPNHDKGISSKAWRYLNHDKGRSSKAWAWRYPNLDKGRSSKAWRYLNHDKGRSSKG
ncbi:hypothetical protein RRG08_064152 [Elysia crispata]|uniref:Uncharacterized protein n=1 Tax=Elysia crispata TaxID=231223 RepID=A0AAE1DIE9_9GAST|nr:hypothetical protein RRG08_064152 [Elysia crispata]